MSTEERGGGGAHRPHSLRMGQKKWHVPSRVNTKNGIGRKDVDDKFAALSLYHR